ncbi:type VI secretion system tip protein TssI/VgrG [Robbsia sp. Bb-Pol-6]|uniref:Type VI secretion system tip protein TssI/VgrG n=1 Tax=Robbsia betulipollinis TaxID=2981849 RepID=A0ABT3ZPA2_9BURK|nr:type VI secretion system tip protein TssI/VgrG [Robbsia betulipollinis]MCY0388381.1 type VI secretion system tip protein TssI/VgrG [Robbsia betulipollinis]
MANGVTQARSFLSVSTPFGADVLSLERFTGREAISAPFSFRLEMRSSNGDLDPSGIIGQPLGVRLARAGQTQRHFHGIVARFVHESGRAEASRYAAVVVPRLWLLTLGSDRAIHQNKSAADIVRAVLHEHNILVEDRLSGTYPVREYCVCYDESPFSFISRLMEEEGIFYFFTFAEGRHTLVLADNAAAHATSDSAPVMRYAPESPDSRTLEAVTQFELEHRVVAQDVTLNDYDCGQSTAPLLVTVPESGGRGARYLYPGKYATLPEGERLASLRLDAQQMAGVAGRGASQCYTLRAGAKFTLVGHHRDALNGVQVVRSVEHAATESAYENRFETFAENRRFRPPSAAPRPAVQGMHTAVVVGPAGEEIWTDDLGRVKVRFHWDRHAARDENSSCWVRVAQAVAGQGWGQLFLPRVGHEVLVSYIDGDPDRPLVTGSVYNDTHTPPVSLPAAQTQSVIRSRSSKAGRAGNEIRMEDRLDHEELFLHAQKDMKIDVENDLHTTLLAGSHRLKVERGDRTIDVREGQETHMVHGDRSVTVGGTQVHHTEGDHRHTVAGNYTLCVAGDLLIDVTGSVAIKAGNALTSQAGTSLSNQAGLDLTNKGGTTLENSAGTTLTNRGLVVESKASATQTVDGGGMLTLKGGMVAIN